MNDLNRKIGELKGWEYVPAGTELFIHGKGASVSEGWIQKIGPMKQFHAAFNCNWASSDSKALELVDELTHDAPNRLGNFSFSFKVMADGRLSAEFVYPGFRAVVPREDMARLAGDHHRFGASDENTPDGRRRAICRAYIAAWEWMAKREG